MFDMAFVGFGFRATAGSPRVVAFLAHSTAPSPFGFRRRITMSDSRGRPKVATALFGPSGQRPP
jgi:hypothetical protein